MAAAARPTLARIALIDQLLAAVSGAGKRGDAVRCGASFFDLALGCIAERESGSRSGHPSKLRCRPSSKF